MGCCSGREKSAKVKNDDSEVGEWTFTIKKDVFVLRGDKITYHFESFLPIGTYPVRVDGTGLLEVRKNGETIHKKENGGVILLRSDGICGVFDVLN